MQVANEHNIIERSLFYWSGLFYNGLKKGSDYLLNARTICICILNYTEFQEGPFHEIATIKREFKNKLLTDKLELHYIQLPKFREKCKIISSKLDEWLTFISLNNLEEVKMINNKYVKQATNELEYLTGDEEERRLAELREKAIRDELAALSRASTLGKEEGFSEGITKGKMEEKKKIAKKMLEQNIDIDIIVNCTGLTKEEIKNIIVKE